MKAIHFLLKGLVLCYFLGGGRSKGAQERGFCFLSFLSDIIVDDVSMPVLLCLLALVFMHNDLLCSLWVGGNKRRYKRATQIATEAAIVFVDGRFGVYVSAHHYFYNIYGATLLFNSVEVYDYLSCAPWRHCYGDAKNDYEPAARIVAKEAMSRRFCLLHVFFAYVLDIYLIFAMFAWQWPLVVFYVL